MKNRVIRARKIFLNGREVKTVVETVCLKCGEVIIGNSVDICPVCGNILRKETRK
jgi:rubrerythrin